MKKMDRRLAALAAGAGMVLTLCMAGVRAGGVGELFPGSNGENGNERPVPPAPPSPPQPIPPEPRVVPPGPKPVPQEPVPQEPPTAPPAAPPTEAAGKPAPPAGAALKDAVKRVAQAYKDPLASAKTSTQKTELAKNILDGVDQKPADDQFAALSRARDLSVEAGDAVTFCAVVGEMDKRFAIDCLQMQADNAPALCKNLRSAEQCKPLVDWSATVTDAASALNRYDICRVMAGVQLFAARALGDNPMQKEASDAMQRAQDLERAWAVVKPAAETLAAKPEDPEANLKVGEFRCFYKGQWKDGVLMLAKGTDKRLAAMAQKEIAGTTDANQQVQLGEGWYQASLTLGSTAKGQTQSHALDFFAAAVPQLSGPLKAQVEARIQEIESGPAVAAGLQPLFAKPEGPELIAQIVSRIPRLMLPLKSETADELHPKNLALDKWFREHPVVDPRDGTEGTILAQLEPGSGPEKPPAANGRDKPTQMVFLQRADFRGMRCLLEVEIARRAGAADGQAPQWDKAPASGIWAVTAKFQEIMVYLQPPTGSSDEPRVMIKLTSRSGAFTVKPAAH